MNSSLLTAKLAGAPGTSSNEARNPSMTLAAAAVAAGRMPGEPATVLAPRPPTLLARLLGFRPRSPLADPRLEVLRAISATLARGVAQIGADFVVAAQRVGWTVDDLRRTFPGVPIQAPA